MGYAYRLMRVKDLEQLQSLLDAAADDNERLDAKAKQLGALADDAVKIAETQTERATELGHIANESLEMWERARDAASERSPCSGSGDGPMDAHYTGCNCAFEKRCNEMITRIVEALK